MNNRIKKFGLVLCSILLIYFIGGIFYSFIDKKDYKEKIIEVEDKLTIKGYDYILKENDSKNYETEFIKLKENLENKKIDYKEYAKSISKMFVIDLYSLDLKTNMYDVGGGEFIYPESVENYKLNVQNTLYKYMKDNSDGKRNQELPIVKNVEVKSIEETTYKIKENEYSGYKLNLDIEYIKDLESDKKAEIIVIKQNKYLYIVEKN